MTSLGPTPRPLEQRLACRTRGTNEDFENLKNMFFKKKLLIDLFFQREEERDTSLFRTLARHWLRPVCAPLGIKPTPRPVGVMLQPTEPPTGARKCLCEPPEGSRGPHLWLPPHVAVTEKWGVSEASEGRGCPRLPLGGHLQGPPQSLGPATAAWLVLPRRTPPDGHPECYPWRHVLLLPETVTAGGSGVPH